MPLQSGATFTRAASDDPSLRALLLMAALNWLLLIVSNRAVIDNSFYSRALLCGAISPAFQGLYETLGSSPGNPPAAHRFPPVPGGLCTPVSYHYTVACEPEGVASLQVLSVYHGSSSATCYQEQKVRSNISSPRSSLH